MVRLTTNAESFANDIAEVIRLFVDMERVIIPGTVDACADEAADNVTVDFFDAGDMWEVSAGCDFLRADGHARSCYTLSYAPVLSSPLAKKRHMKRAVKIAVFRAMRKLFDVETPWGSLTGIRPTHLMRELMSDASYSYEGEPLASASSIMRSEFDVSEEKLSLCAEILGVQAPFIDSVAKNDVDVYIGIPYCKTRCLYCSFLSDVRTKKTDMVSYIGALKRDIAMGAEILDQSGRKVRSVYMGGGTPTVLTEDELEDVLSFALEAYGTFGCELTVEAGRPDTITREKLRMMKRMGVTRISINPQSMNEKTLAIIGRSHSPGEIVNAMHDARDAGFDVINMDVIAGLMGEELDDMKRTLGMIASLSPENLTVHTLAIKRSSRLKEKLDEYPLPGDDTAAAMVREGADAARAMGMRPYYMYRQKYMRGNLENVGYALPGCECVYNIDIMEETSSIMAHGAGAISKCLFGGERRVERVPNPKEVAVYIEKLDAVNEKRRALWLG